MSLRRAIQDRPHALEKMWQFAEWALHRLTPLFARGGYERSARIILPAEDLGKKLVFNCQLCGQCILRYSGPLPTPSHRPLTIGLCGWARRSPRARASCRPSSSTTWNASRPTWPEYAIWASTKGFTSWQASGLSSRSGQPGLWPTKLEEVEEIC